MTMNDETEPTMELIEDHADQEETGGFPESAMEIQESTRVGTTASARFNVLSTVRDSILVRVLVSLCDRM
jgi:hypothetical protein